MRAKRQWLSDGKNCAMSKTKELVAMFLIYPIWMKCVRVIPTSVVDLNFKPPNWLWWMKLLEMMWNWSPSPMTFSISFPKELRSTMGLKDLGESYNALLGFGITMVIEFLKWLGQYPISIHALAMVMMFFKHVLSLTTRLRFPHDNLLGPGADKLLHLTIVLVDSSSENDDHDADWYEFSSFNTFSSTWQNWAVLNEEWRACQRSFSSKQGQPLYLIISMAGRTTVCLRTPCNKLLIKKKKKKDPRLTNHHIRKYCHFHLAHCPYRFFSHRSTSNQHMSPILEKSGFLTRKWWPPRIAILSCRSFWMEPGLKIRLTIRWILWLELFSASKSGTKRKAAVVSWLLRCWND